MWSDVDGETKIDFWECWFMFNRQVILPSDNYSDAIVIIWVIYLIKVTKTVNNFSYKM